MNKRSVLVLWAIALLLVVALVVVKSSRSDDFESATERERGETLLKDFDPREVATMTIRRGEETVTLAKKDGLWVVDERDAYPANVRNLNELLRLIAEVKVTQGIQAEAEFAPRFGMDPKAEDEAERGTEVVLLNDAGTELAHLTFGKNLEAAANPLSPFGGGSTGRFVRNHADSSGVYVTSELFGTLNSDAKRWLDDAFLKVEKIQSISVTEAGKPDTAAWTITRADETADFTLEGKAENEKLSATALNPLKSLFSYARFEDVVPAADAEKVWQDGEKQTATITTFEGITYEVTFAPKSDSTEEASTRPYIMTVSVSGEVPAERKKEEGESEEDAKAKQEAFDARKKQLEEALAAAKKLEGRLFQVSKFTVDPLLKDRPALIESAPPAQTGTGPSPGATAVTPPVAIPALPQQ